MAERDRAAVDVHLVAIEAQLFLHRKVLRRERFVHFDEIHVLQRQPGLLEDLARRGRRSHAHQRGLDADIRPVREPRERLQAARFDALLRREQQRRRAVDDAAGVAGGNAAILTEGRRQFCEPLHRRIGPHVIVLRKELHAFARFELHRHDFLF